MINMNFWLSIFGRPGIAFDISTLIRFNHVVAGEKLNDLVIKSVNNI